MLTNQKATRGGRQPITIENGATEDEGVKESVHAAASIKQTIKAFCIKQNDKMRANESKLQQLAIKTRVKIPFTIALNDRITNIPLKPSI